MANRIHIADQVGVGHCSGPPGTMTGLRSVMVTVT